VCKHLNNFKISTKFILFITVHQLLKGREPYFRDSWDPRNEKFKNIR